LLYCNKLQGFKLSGITVVKFSATETIKPFIEEKGFDKFFNEFKNNVEFPFKSFPKVDVVDDEKSIRLIAELPGVRKEDVKILFENGILSVSGEKKNELETNEEINVIRNERLFGKFERKFNLFEDINPDKITAKFEHGLLKISIDKLVPEKPKERIIEVK
jgi:HSP20 family protein